MLAIQAPTMNIAGCRIMQKLAMRFTFLHRAFRQHPHGLLSATKGGVCWRRPYSNSIDQSYHDRQGLIPWIRQQGGHVGPLELQYNELEGWNVRTTETIKAGETLISLPPHLRLSMESANKHLRLLFDLHPERAAWHFKLALTLLSEQVKNESSRWWPYIQSLLHRYDRLPVFSYSSDEMQALEDPYLISELKKSRGWTHELIDEVLRLLLLNVGLPGIGSLFVHSSYPKEAFTWALAAVMTRNFTDESRENQVALLPLADMCNFSFAPTAIEAPAAGLDREFIAAKDLERGESVNIDYGGALGNRDLFLDYGFVIPKNPYDRVLFSYDGDTCSIGNLTSANVPRGCMLQWIIHGRFPTRHSSPYDGQLLDWIPRMQKLDSSFRNPTPRQQELLLRLKRQPHDPSEEVSLGDCGLVDGRLLAAVRLMHHAQPDSNVDLETLKEWGQKPPLGVVNEVKALLTLKALVERQLAAFSTSVSEDDKILADDISLTPNLRVAIQYRRIMKQLLLDNVAALEAKASTLTN